MKTINIIAYFTLFITFIFLMVLAYWQFYPYRILELKDGNAFIENTKVYGGEYLKMHQLNCKYMDLESTINRQFVDTIIYTVPPTFTKRPLGCHDLYEYVYVPRGLPSGKYYIKTTVTYKVNPIRTVSYVITTNEFTLLESTESADLR